MKNHPHFRTAIPSLLALGVLSAHSLAAPDATSTKAPEKTNVAKTTTPAMTLPKTLTEQDLNSPLKTLEEYAGMMQKAGYTTKQGKTVNGKPALSIGWKKDTWNFLANFSMNEVNGNSYLSIVSPLPTIPDMTKIPVASVVAMLELQDATLGWSFVLSKQSQRFYLARMLPAQGLTSRILLSELKVLESNAVRSQPLWDSALWVKAPQAPAASKQD